MGRSRCVEKARKETQSTSTNSSSSSSLDDIHSLCGSLSKSFTRSFPFFVGSKEPTPNPNSQPIALSAPHLPPRGRSMFSKVSGQERTYTEAANNSCTLPIGVVRYDCVRDVQEITMLGANRSFEKQSHRAKKNPWRQYGALRKLHEVGGSAPNGLSRNARKKKDAYVDIRSGSEPPSPPNCREIIFNLDPRMYLLNTLRVPKRVPGEELAHRIAVEMKQFVDEGIKTNTSSSGHNSTILSTDSRSTWSDLRQD